MNQFQQEDADHAVQIRDQFRLGCVSIEKIHSIVCEHIRPLKNRLRETEIENTNLWTTLNSMTEQRDMLMNKLTELMNKPLNSQPPPSQT